MSGFEVHIESDGITSVDNPNSGNTGIFLINGSISSLMCRPKEKETYTRIKGFEITAVEVPPLIFNIDVNNNTIVANSVILQISVGTYTYNSLATSLENKLNTETTGWSVVFDSKTLKYTITRSGNTFVINGGTLIGRIIKITTGLNTSVTSITTTNVANITTIPYYFLSSDVLSNYKKIKNVSNDNSTSNIITKVHTSGFNKLLNNKVEFDTARDIEFFDLRLTNNVGSPLELGNRTFSVSIVFYK